ncbi:hypothetical protein NRIC_26580 [Enterococcus florum]|uniref:Sensor histidine kinase NatK-like C-terminal domain-containing protein n=1 Tax=Enterococcus florum TaxID=2480627 RepID=A0A4P5P9L2_9ENTE|nr:sensor histidine kinase [Enterococcus florum]GCF94767.1 hypothetical protein NRIC_26580 [Enterococcus florum]
MGLGEILLVKPAFLITTGLVHYLLGVSFLPIKTGFNKKRVFSGILITIFCYRVLNNYLLTILAPSSFRAVLFYSISYLFFLSNMRFFAGKIHLKLFLGFFYLSVITISETLMWGAVLYFVGNERTTQLVLVEWDSGAITSYIMLLITCLIWRARLGKHSYLSKKIMAIHTSIIVLCIFLGFTLVLRENFISVGIFSIVLILFFIYFRIVEDTSRKIHSYRLDEEKNRLMKDHYDQIEAYQQKIQILRHDMKHQLIHLRGQVEKKPRSLIIQHVDGMLDEIDQVQNQHFTDHEAVNIIVGHKYRRGQEAGVACSVTIEIPPVLSLEERDLIALIGNLFDNALEACDYCQEEKQISFRMVQRHGCLAIRLENTTDGTHQSFRTRKKEKQMHGFGMKSILEIVQKYAGKIDYSWIENRFILEITFFED